MNFQAKYSNLKIEKKFKTSLELETLGKVAMICLSTHVNLKTIDLTHLKASIHLSIKAYHTKLFQAICPTDFSIEFSSGDCFFYLSETTINFQNNVVFSSRLSFCLSHLKLFQFHQLAGGKHDDFSQELRRAE